MNSDAIIIVVRYGRMRCVQIRSLPEVTSQVSLSLDQRLHHSGPIFCPPAQKLVPPKGWLRSTLHVPATLEIDVLDATRGPPHSVLRTPLGRVTSLPVGGRLGLAGDGVQRCLGKQRRREVHLAGGTGEVVQAAVVVYQRSDDLPWRQGRDVRIVIRVRQAIVKGLPRRNEALNVSFGCQYVS